MKSSSKILIYMDICALERPYDDQKYYRINLETIAVNLIIAYVRQKKITLYYSPVHEDEIAFDENVLRLTEVEFFLTTCAQSAKKLTLNSERLEKRGREFRKAGLGIADAFHLAYAEELGAYFITCDDDLLKKARKCKLRVWLGTPIEFCQKENIT